MPDIDKPLPPDAPPLTRPDDIVAQIREATYSPSPLIRILHDPTILPSDLSNYSKSRRLSPRRDREHRTETVAALAIAEEEKQSRLLKRLLRNSGERLEFEIRRADAATLRADIAERQEKTYLARAQSAEVEKDEIRKICNGLERELRDYQMQLDVTQRELQLLHADLEERQREIEGLQSNEARAEADVRNCRNQMQEQFERQNLEMQNAIHEWYENGREDGYGEGYKAGKKSGTKDGIQKGRKEGLIEGIDKGKHEERRTAMEAIEKYLTKSDDQRGDRIRRWAQSIYSPGTVAETVYPVDSGSV